MTLDSSCGRYLLELEMALRAFWDYSSICEVDSCESINETHRDELLTLSLKNWLFIKCLRIAMGVEKLTGSYILLRLFGVYGRVGINDSFK